jgi:hypothetical protein
MQYDLTFWNCRVSQKVSFRREKRPVVVATSITHTDAMIANNLVSPLTSSLVYAFQAPPCRCVVLPEAWARRP